MKNILVLDNYDSFTYNLVHIVRELGYEDGMDIFRNDRIDLNEVDNYDNILLSPGPGLPKEAGIMPELIKKYFTTKNIMGVCLGHQAIGEAFGASLHNLSTVFHGVATEIEHDETDVIFSGIPKSFNVCRYHSWVIDPEDFPDQLQITARDRNGQIMAVKHVKYNVHGVQFHPESIMTEHGKEIISNWLTLSK